MNHPYVKSFLFSLFKGYEPHRWLFQRLFDASPDSDIPKNVPFTYVINTHKPKETSHASFRAREGLCQVPEQVAHFVDGDRGWEAKS